MDQPKQHESDTPKNMDRQRSNFLWPTSVITCWIYHKCRSYQRKLLIKISLDFLLNGTPVKWISLIFWQARVIVADLVWSCFITTITENSDLSKVGTIEEGFNLFLKLFGPIYFISKFQPDLGEDKTSISGGSINFSICLCLTNKGIYENNFCCLNTQERWDFRAINRVNRIFIFKYPEYCPKGHTCIQNRLNIL